MIKSFKDKKTEKFYNGEFVKKFAGVERQAQKRLRILKAAPDLKALQALRSNRFEALLGDRKDQYSIRINNQWRICFKWDEGATEIEITDYH
ncbi:plasmid maintenance system killer protein [Candidatus Nitromaritima sp. SCGC AAA799-C22]|nr:plasmid maintenance system killer protein [Candidatus Nitromaritima sp. SCGC AAA799-C22]